MKKAMIFAAGLGTRLAPLTNDRPKALVELKGRSLLWHVADRLADEGFNDLTINIHHFADKIRNYVESGAFAEHIKKRGLSISLSDESRLLLDTGGGLKKAQSKLFGADKYPVLVHNVDIMSNARLSELYDALGGADALLLVSERKSTRYLLFDDEMRLVGWQNTLTGEIRTPYRDLVSENYRRLAFSGIHVVTHRLTEAMKEWPECFGITDFYIRMCRSLDIRGYVQTDLVLTDVGKIEVLERLEQL